MNDIETRFIEQYKLAEAELNRRLGARHGVTEYINGMESTPLSMQRLVPTWRKDLRSLKHLRWLRNRIVHEESETECDEFDVIEITDFYERLLDGSDPVSAAVNSKNERRPAPAPERDNSEPENEEALTATDDPTDDENAEQKSSGRLRALIVVIILFLLTLGLRFLIASQTATCVLVMSIFGPLAVKAGLSPLGVLGVSYTASNIWITNYQNPAYIAGLSNVEGRVKHKDTLRASLCHVLVCLAGCLVSIPYWAALGYL